MKTRLLVLVFCVVGGVSIALFRASAELEISTGVSIHAATDFYEPLAPNGTWVEVDSYGRCWQPSSHPSTSVMPSGNPAPNKKRQDMDKDHGHDNP
jgi:hypothetical protein